MKKCKLCKLTLSKDDFYLHNQHGKNGQIWPYFDCYCKKCRSDYQTKRKQNIKKEAVDYLGGECKNCKLKTDQLCVYDFHHRDKNEKDYSIAKQSKSFDKIKNELDKCDLLCANCHRIEHDKK